MFSFGAQEKAENRGSDVFGSTVDPVTNDLASAKQKKSLVAESCWSQERFFAVKIVSAAPGSMSG